MWATLLAFFQAIPAFKQILDWFSVPVDKTVLDQDAKVDAEEDSMKKGGRPQW